MKHVHEKTGKNFEVGQLIDFDGKTFDINVITKWDEENDFEQSPMIIDYYFGDYDKETTNDYIEMFLERQQQLQKAINVLSAIKLLDSVQIKGGLDDTIKVLNEMLVTGV